MQSIVSTRRNSQHKSHNFHIHLEEKKKTKTIRKRLKKGKRKILTQVTSGGGLKMIDIKTL